ncbi:MAG: hypothetical protein COA78_21215 [Blastopirellula sp.]|nr:MAG: hypothetical protein COA78_21215 [Blastopirellula sp.]
MSKIRKSFILHHDSLNVLDDLTDDQAGLLFKAIKAYHLGDELKLDVLTNIAMSPFRNQFDRDAIKYEKLCEKNRLIAETRYATKSTTGKAGNQALPQATKSTDNDSKSDSKSKSDNDSNKEVTNDRFAEFWNLYGKKSDSAKCKAKFSKMSKSDIELIFEKLPAYVKSTPDKQYRKNPITWLNGKCWNDEIMQQSNQAKSTHTFEAQNYQSGKF